jgi:hypothetical protein
MAAARVLSVRGVVYCENSAPLEGRLSVELSDPGGALLSGTMTEPDGSFLICADAGAILRCAEVSVSVWRGTSLVRQLTLSAREILSRSLWIPIEETSSLLKVRGELRDDMGAPAASRRIRVVRVVARPDGRLVKRKIGEGLTDGAGVFSISCAIPRNEAAQPIIQVQAFDGEARPAVCAMIHQTTGPISPIRLTLPSEPTLILTSLPAQPGA